MTAPVFTNTMLSPFTAPTFEILAGPEQTRFVAHAGVLEKSEKLKAVTCGNWKDGSECKIVLEDWDPKTVGRLLEWLYSGDYESPSPAEAPHFDVESSGTRVSETTVPSKQGADLPCITPKKIESARGSNRPLTSLQHIYFDEASPNLARLYAETFEPWAKRFEQDPSTLNFEATLLAHAKLYALADYMLLPALQAQAFDRLKAVLTVISPCPYTFYPAFRIPIANLPVIGNLVTLIQYVYANTTRLESKEEPLRELVSTFIVSNYDQFSDDGGLVQTFMEQGGDFHGDVHDKMRRHQIALKEELKALRNELY